METEKAKKIVAHMIAWSMYHIGVQKIQPDPMEYSLSEMIQANEMVENLPPVPQPNGITHRYLTVDDRIIAALYVCMHYEGDSPEDAKSIACHGNKFLYVLREEG